MRAGRKATVNGRREPGQSSVAGLWRLLWRIVLRVGSPENRGKTRLLRCGGCEGK